MKIHYRILIHLMLVIFMMTGFFIMGCHEKNLTPGEYIAWVQDPGNGLKESVMSDDYLFDLQYKPAAYIAIMEQRTTPINKEQFEDAIDQLGTLHYFDLKIRRLDGQDFLGKGSITDIEYNERFDYMVGMMQGDFALLTGSDTTTCSMYHYEATGGVGSYHTFLLAFESIKQDSLTDIILLYDDKLFGTGPVVFLVKKESLDNLIVFNPN